MEIGYQADFDVPLFDVILQAPELQARIYAGVRAIYPYALNTDDMHVSTGGMQSDTGLRIKMFGGNASVNLTPVRLAIDFSKTNLRYSAKAIMLAVKNRSVIALIRSIV